MNHKSPERSSHGIINQSRNLGVVLCLGMLAGVLIWAKLRLVTDIPRSAYADPREVEIPDQDPEGLVVHDDQTQESDSDNGAETTLNTDPITNSDDESLIKP